MLSGNDNEKTMEVPSSLLAVINSTFIHSMQQHVNLLHQTRLLPIKSHVKFDLKASHSIVL